MSAVTGTAFIEDAAKAFEQKYPGTKVTMVEAPSNTFQTTIRAQLAAGHAPDVMFVWSGAANAMSVQPLAKAGYLENLSDHSWVSSVGDTANGLVSYEGNVYALNTYLNPIVIFYNKDLLSSLNASIPKTFTELLSFCDSVNSQGIVPIALGNQTGYINAMPTLQMANSIMYSKNPNTAKDFTSGSYNWTNSQEWKDSLKQGTENYVQMVQHNCFEANSTGVSDSNADQLVAQKKALGTDIISSGFPQLQGDNPDIKFDSFELPATDNPADTWLTSNVGAAYAVNAKSTNLSTANAFVDFLGQSDNLAKAASLNFGLPYQSSPDVKMPDEFAGIADLYESQSALYQMNYWPNAQIKTDMIAAWQDLVLGKMDAAAQDAAISKVMAAFGGQ